MPIFLLYLLVIIGLICLFIEQPLKTLTSLLIALAVAALILILTASPFLAGIAGLFIFFWIRFNKTNIS